MIPGNMHYRLISKLLKAPRNIRLKKTKQKRNLCMRQANFRKDIFSFVPAFISKTFLNKISVFTSDWFCSLTLFHDNESIHCLCKGCFYPEAFI